MVLRSRIPLTASSSHVLGTWIEEDVLRGAKRPKR